MRTRRLLRVGGFMLAGVLLLLAMSVPAMARHAPVAATVTAVSFDFDPNEVSIPEGTNLLFVNDDDGVPHTLSGINGRFDSGVIFGDADTVVTTEHLRPGTYQFFCRVHPDMLGTLTVTGG